jgi:EAL domain-containing protein (putative c-di-GMP-specific phosphodiesterase class I)
MHAVADGDADRKRLKQLLAALDHSGSDCALCFHFSRSPLFQRRPDFMILARQAFLKQTAILDFRRFVLPTGDLVLTGLADLPERIDAAVNRLCDLAVCEESEEAHPPLISYFDLHAPDDVEALAAIVDAPARPHAARKRPLTPTEVAKICARLTERGVADLIRTQTALSLGASGSGPLFREAFVSLADLQRQFATDIELCGRPLFRYLLETLDRCVLRDLPVLPNQRTDIPLSINLSFNTLSSPEFADFRAANPFCPPLFVEIQTVDVLAAPAAFETLRLRLKDSGVTLVADGILLSLLDQLDLSSLRPGPLKIAWDEAKDAKAVTARTGALRRAAEQIGRENIILCRVDSEAGIACALGAGVTRVQGRLIERLAAKADAT